MKIIDNINVKVNVNQPSLRTSVNIPDVNIKAKIQAPLTEVEYERDYNKLLNIPTINGVEVKGNKIASDFEIHTSELINDGDGISPFATEKYVDENGGKIDKIILNDNEQQIINKTVSLRVNKTTVGLGNANNTSDLDKPVSTAQANAINQVQSNLDEHLSDYENPHKVNKTQIGLSNVDNTSDLDKPISTQTQEALNTVNKNLDTINDDVETINNNLNSEIERSTLAENEINEKLQQEMNTRVEEHAEIQQNISDINSKIPSQASSSNQLADKAFVNSTINSSAAFFKGNFATKAALDAIQWQTTNPALNTYVTNNDYAYIEADETHDNEAWRYIYVLNERISSWQAQFRVNETPFTQAQLDAINSGATVSLISSINLKLTANDIVDETGDSSLKAISQRAATLGINAVQSNLNTHINDKNNPHQVTKAQLGLNNVNNTSDLDKPISTAVREALNNYLPLSGGQMTGRLSFRDGDAIPYFNTLAYIVGIDSYADGGGIKYTNFEDFRSQLNCLSLTGGQMAGAIRFLNSGEAAPDVSTHTALSYGRLQAYGTLNINANTDNSGVEYVNITAGHGCSSSTADGLSIGTDTLTWKNQDVALINDTIETRNYFLTPALLRTGSGATGITPSIDANGYWKIVVASGNGNWLSWGANNDIEENFSEGETFTFSITIKCDAGSTGKPNIYFKSGMGYYPMVGTVSESFSVLYYTGRWSKTNDISFHLGWHSTQGTFYISKIKFEKGDKPHCGDINTSNIVANNAEINGTLQINGTLIV